MDLVQQLRGLANTLEDRSKMGGILTRVRMLHESDLATLRRVVEVYQGITALLRARGVPYQDFDREYKHANIPALVERLLDTPRDAPPAPEVKPVGLTDAERKLAGILLDMASDEFGRHGCNDFDLVPHFPDRDDRDALVRAACYPGSGLEYADNDLDSEAKGYDYRLMDFAAFNLIRKRLAGR